MAINYKAGQAPKGPSNSNQMSSTPGTQQSALRNVGGLNLNPNMPAGPQMQKRQRSSYQQSVNRQQAPAGPTMPRTPSPTGPTRAGAMGGARSRVVSQGAPMDPGRGYNVFAGMDAGQISDMNQRMGMSNMTALPSVRDAGAGMGLRPGEQMSKRLMVETDTYGMDSSSAPAATPAPSEEGGFVDPVGVGVSGFSVDPESFAEKMGKMTDIGDPTSQEQEIAIAQGESDPATYEEDIYKFYEDPYPGVESQLDQKYAMQLQQVLAGLDRQAAMMGMLGSPAHTNMINTAISGALETMAGEYAQLEKDRSQARLNILGEIAQLEDVKAAFFGDVQATSDLSSNIFAGVSQEIGNLQSQGQIAVFDGYMTTINNQFQREFMNAENTDQAYEIYLKYQKIAQDFQRVISGYIERRPVEEINTLLNDVFAQAGLGSDYAGQEGIYISYYN